jgi:hypothetical protein
VHVLAGTQHGNFSDVIWWLPAWFLKRSGLGGSSDPEEVYAKTTSLMHGFLAEQAAGANSEKAGRRAKASSKM